MTGRTPPGHENPGARTFAPRREFFTADCCGDVRTCDLRWATLPHDVGKTLVRTEKADRSNYINHDLLGAVLVERIALQLKLSNDHRAKVKDLVLKHVNVSIPLRQADTAAHS